MGIVGRANRCPPPLLRESFFFLGAGGEAFFSQAPLSATVGTAETWPLSSRHFIFLSLAPLLPSFKKGQPSLSFDWSPPDLPSRAGSMNSETSGRRSSPQRNTSPLSVIASAIGNRTLFLSTGPSKGDDKSGQRIVAVDRFYCNTGMTLLSISCRENNSSVSSHRSSRPSGALSFKSFWSWKTLDCSV